MRRVVFLLLVIMLGGLASTVAAEGTPVASPHASPVIEPPDCKGLTAYREQMLVVARDYIAALERDGIPFDRPLATYSTDDWAALAVDALTYQRALRAVVPPPWAASWHQTAIEYAGLLEQVGKAGATAGIFAVAALGDELDAAEDKSAKEADAAGDRCFAFRAFHREWMALDEATPTPTPIH